MSKGKKVSYPSYNKLPKPLQKAIYQQIEQQDLLTEKTMEHIYKNADKIADTLGTIVSLDDEIQKRPGMNKKVGEMKDKIKYVLQKDCLELAFHCCDDLMQLAKREKRVTLIQEAVSIVDQFITNDSMLYEGDDEWLLKLYNALHQFKKSHKNDEYYERFISDVQRQLHTGLENFYKKEDPIVDIEPDIEKMHYN